MKALLFALFMTVAVPAFAQIITLDSEDRIFFHSTDSLAPRDDYGLMHQGPVVNDTDLAPRYHWRPLYYFEGDKYLEAQPAYVGALQRELHRRGYYCGPIDGVYSWEVADAVSRMQKNFAMRVTGTITIPVRRALHLP